jgi:ferredoxin
MASADDFFFRLECENFHRIIEALHHAGYRVIGPTVQDGAVIYDELTSADELPRGWADKQSRGAYQLVPQAEQAFFGYTLSPQSWKRFLHPPDVRLWQAERSNGAFQIEPEAQQVDPMAFVGVRPCELQAIAIQDRVFLEGAFVDPIYQARRQNLFIVAVDCSHSSETCFCTSLGTGPGAVSGYDLALTEVLDEGAHYFVGRVGSDKGRAVLNTLVYAQATEEEMAAAERMVAQASAQIQRRVDTAQLGRALYAHYESAQWDQVAQQCMACGNCTMVCPTCFCTTIQDVTDLTGTHAERHRLWDSCFTMDFSYIHGGSVRYSARARYRQWLMHKMSTWVDQFGTLGCVGCGRCITWCPVGIDITQEVLSVRAGKSAEKSVNHEDN